MPYGWEGNRKSGVALSMRHTKERPKEDHPAYTIHGVWAVWHTLPLPLK